MTFNPENSAVTFALNLNPMSSKKSRIAVFASGNGTNAEEIFRYFKNHPSIGVGLLLSNNPHAFVLERAKKFNIPSKVFTREEFKNPDLFISWLHEKEITHLVLAGFLKMIPDYLTKAYPEKIINIHPALLPKFGGKGMYGIKVHEAVRQSGEKETGITIHLVNDQYDEGKILFQAKCAVQESYSPEEINECVQKLEYEHYPKVIEQWILNKAASF